ncbi:hypothetical protein Tco_0414937 [Tanacetum coccineum]
MFTEFSSDDLLLKLSIFVIVQGLVYLILSNSSNVFSKSKMTKSFSFKPARSVSIRRIFAAIAEMPSGGEESPSSSSRGMRSFSTSEEELFRFDSLIALFVESVPCLYNSIVLLNKARGKKKGLVTHDLEGHEFEKICNKDKSLSEIQLEHEKEDGFVVTLGGSGGESFWEGGDDFGVDVLRFYTCLIDILGFLEKLEWWFEQDIDDEEEEDKEGEGGSEV